MAAVLTMPDALSRYIAQAASQPWSWGECDCLLFLADWVRCRTGIDPAGEYRGAYHDQRSARRLMVNVGGIGAMVDLCARRAGYCEIKGDAEPRRGDIGLVQVPFKPWRERMIHVPCGSICIRPNLWAVKPADGRQLVARDFIVLRRWSLSGG